MEFKENAWQYEKISILSPIVFYFSIFFCLSLLYLLFLITYCFMFDVRNVVWFQLFLTNFKTMFNLSTNWFYLLKHLLIIMFLNFFVLSFKTINFSLINYTDWCTSALFDWAAKIRDLCYVLILCLRNAIVNTRVSMQILISIFKYVIALRLSSLVMAGIKIWLRSKCKK